MISLLLSSAIALSPGARAPAPLLRAAIAPRAPAAVAYSVEDPIDVGGTLPDVEVEIMNGFDSVGAGDLGATKRISEVLGSGKAILLGMPGAFTPTCTDVHLPGYYNLAGQLRDAGVNKIALVTTNDRFVNAQWQKVRDGGINLGP